MYYFQDKYSGFEFGSIFHYRGALLKYEAIVITESNVSKYIEFINAHEIDKIIIDVKASRLLDLSFLKETPHVKYLKILGDIDYSTLYELKEIKSLEINGLNEIDVSKIEGLQVLISNYPSRLKNLNLAKTLKSLWLYGYGDTKYYQDFSSIKELKQLDTLYLRNIKCTSLDGIESLNNLKVLLLINNLELSNIEAISRLNFSLKHLEIENCRRINNIECLSALEQLIYLRLQKFLYIPSLSFLKSLGNLRTFLLFESNVIDGNMSPIIELETQGVLPIRNHFFYYKNGEAIKFTDDYKNFGKRTRGDLEIELWRRTDM